MPNLLKYCCASPEASVNPKMESTNELNGHHVPNNCPFSDSVEKPVKPNLRVKVPQPMKLINHLTEEESYDVLHSQLEDYTIVNSKCTEKVCGNSIMDIPHRGDIPRLPEEVYVDAEKFLRQYFQSIHRENSEAHKARLDEVKRELESRGTYQLKTSELVYGAKLAWRNASRCIMRIQWKKLQIFDCREVTTASGMFEALCNHIKYATNKGNIRSAMTIFPQRTDGKHDYRIWNPQLINYAGYLQPDGSVLGDAARIEITQVCIKLGWKPPYTAWDILPLVLSAGGKDPEYFEYPPEIIKEIHLEHPKYEWFKEIGIRWYAVPAVSNMRLDCGGLEFTGNAFNGWYMGAEIGCRNLCDANRRNMTEIVGKRMGLDTHTNSSLWKDKALVEINIAVLHSFQRDNVSIVDHHTASDQFMKHLETENKIRGGCPADWIWLVPPMSGSIVPLFHQEMSLYFLRPSYDYQEPAWKTHQWSKSEGKRVHRKFHFKQIARAVKFTSKLFGRALSKRIKATILYATETGKSEQYAKELGTIFGHAFNAQVHCMSEYDMFSIEHETLLIIVTSTFGNGEPPANGVDFAEHLYKMLMNEKKLQGEEQLYSGSAKIPTPKSLLRTNSSLSPSFEYKRQLTRLESNKSSIAATSSIEHIGPLSNVCYAVFALGSSTYPKFCNFGKTVDGILHDLGGERIIDLACGDEIYGQEQQFKTWSSNIFHVACETFCLDESEMIKDAKKALTSMPLNEETVRFSKVSETTPMKNALESSFKKHLVTCKVRSNKYLGKYTDDRATIFVDLEPEVEIKYEPGDHLGVMPCNQKVIVDNVLNKLKEVNQYDFPVQLQTMKDTLTPTGSVKTWERYDRIPPVSVRDIFTRFLDITTPPSTTLLKYLATTCTNEKEAQEMMELATDSHKYDDWRHHNHPHLAEVFEQFPSCRPQGSLLATLLPSLQHRFYSISSSPVEHKHRIHATVALVVYKTQSGNGPTHYGVCSNYLKRLKPGDEVFVFVRRAPNFHMPKDTSAPLILVGPGSGIAPFRGFWQHRRHQIKHAKPGQEFGPIWLFFGCRTREMDLYKDEKERAIADGVITKNKLALSRDQNYDKKHVQMLLEEEGEEIVRMLLTEDGHFYVCGDCKMAEEVQQKLKLLLRKHAQMTVLEVDDFIIELMDENRYHEDIFGITLRTAEVQSASREYAKRTRLSSSQSQP